MRRGSSILLDQSVFETIVQVTRAFWPSHYTAIALDSNNNPYIVFERNSTNTFIVVEAEVGKQWIQRIVDYGHSLGGRGLDIAIDEEDVVHLVYQDEDSVWYARFPVEYISQ